jgi:hypothetical protein
MKIYSLMHADKRIEKKPTEPAFIIAEFCVSSVHNRVLKNKFVTSTSLNF